MLVYKVCSCSCFVGVWHQRIKMKKLFQKNLVGRYQQQNSNEQQVIWRDIVFNNICETACFLKDDSGGGGGGGGRPQHTLDRIINAKEDVSRGLGVTNLLFSLQFLRRHSSQDASCFHEMVWVLLLIKRSVQRINFLLHNLRFPTSREWKKIFLCPSTFSFFHSREMRSRS